MNDFLRRQWEKEDRELNNRRDNILMGLGLIGFLAFMVVIVATVAYGSERTDWDPGYCFVNDTQIDQIHQPNNVVTYRAFWIVFWYENQPTEMYLNDVNQVGKIAVLSEDESDLASLALAQARLDYYHLNKSYDCYKNNDDDDLKLIWEETLISKLKPGLSVLFVASIISIASLIGLGLTGLVFDRKISKMKQKYQQQEIELASKVEV